jgi:hypothetical protein
MYLYYTLHLVDACTQDVFVRVRKLAAAALQAMRDNEYRPQHDNLYVAEVALKKRPIYVQNPTRRLIAVFNKLPQHGLPFGQRVLVVGIPCRPGCTGQCTGQCRGPLKLEVRWDPLFPLDFIETRYALGRLFNIDVSEILHTHPSWIAEDFPCGDELAISEMAAAEHGRRLSDTTIKLEATIEALPNICNNRHLMPQFIVWYKEEHGQEPCDPKGSFRHAVKGCIKRIEQRRKRQS